MRLLRTIEKLLPPPELLRLSGLGVDISESSIKYIGFRPSYTGFSHLSLHQYGEVDLGENVLLGGEIKDASKLVMALKEVKKKTGMRHMRLSLPEERVYVFETEVEGHLSDKEIRSQIEFRLEENVPLSPRDAYFDFQISATPNTTGHYQASVTVCAKEVVDGYFEACRQAGVKPLSFEVESAAIARAVLPKDEKGTRLLLDFGKTRTGLGIVHDNNLLYTSTIDIGGEDLSAALTRQIGQKTEAEFTKLKNDIGLAKSSSGVNPAESLLPIVSAIKDEMQTRIQYWNEKNLADRSISEVILCGGSVNLRGITTYFTETLGIETRLADVWQNAFDSKLVTPPIDRRHSYGYATAIGLALASFTTDT